MSKKRSFALRTVIGTRDHRLGSGIWRIWQGKNTDDIYIAPRSIAGEVKASFHPSGYCYIGFPKQFAEHLLREGHHVPPGRAWTSWKRPDTPDDQCLWAAEIWFPPGPLYDPDDPIPKETWIIEPPPDGKAVVISIGFSRVPKGEATIPSDVCELGYTRLSTGECVVVFARPVDFDYQAFRTERLPQLLASFTRPKILTSEEQILNARNPRIFIVNDPKVDGYLKLMDIPVTVSRT